MDVSLCDFQRIPEEYFDAVVLSHIIEHLPNGERVITKLIPKLRKGGVIYVEWPSFRSLWLPSMRGTLNFCDDPTHVRLYSRKDIIEVLKRAGCKVLRCGVRRNIGRLLLWPLIALRNRWQRGYLEASDFWELLGFADFVFAKRQ